MQRTLFTSLLFAVLCQGLFAQLTGTQILEKVSQTYKAANTLEFNITYTYYDNVNTIKPLKISKGFVKMSGSRYLMNIDGVQIIRNDTFMVMLNTKNKMLMIDSASATPPGNLQIGVPTDSLLKYMGEVKVTESGKNYLVSVLNTGNTETLVKKTILTINKESFFIEKITVLYNTITDEDSGETWNPKMVVDYGGIKINGVVDESVFSETRFIIKKGDKVLPAVAYKKYELINHLD